MQAKTGKTIPDPARCQASKKADPEDAESELAELKLVEVLAVAAVALPALPWKEAPADAEIGERVVDGGSVGFSDLLPMGTGQRFQVEMPDEEHGDAAAPNKVGLWTCPGQWKDDLMSLGCGVCLACNCKIGRQKKAVREGACGTPSIRLPLANPLGCSRPPNKCRGHGDLLLGSTTLSL